MDLKRLADILLIILMIGSFILTYIENFELECFNFGSFMFACFIFMFSYIYGRVLVNL